MAWVVERAELSDGRSTFLVVDEFESDVQPEVLEFVHALYAVDRSPNTVRTYLRPIAKFLTWCDREGVDWRRVHLIDMARFKRAVEMTPVRGGGLPAAATVSIALTAVCEFLRYAAAAGHIPAEVPMQFVERKWMPIAAGGGPRDPSGRVRAVRVNALRAKVVERPPAVLGADQQRDLVQSAVSDRDRVLVRVMLEGGLRIGEALGLRFEDIHFLPDSSSLGCRYGGPHMHVIRRPDNDNGALAKSYQARVVPVDDDLVGCYRDYRYERDRRCGLDDVADYIFCQWPSGTAHGRPAELPAGGHENCPFMANRSAHRGVVASAMVGLAG